MLGWKRPFSPYERICQVPVELVRSALERIFERRNKPGAFRVDNGEPFGAPANDAPTPLALWLIAHDIDMIWNKPRCPQMNGVVEHMQDTSCRWAEIHLCASYEELQENLDREAIVQREHFPVTRLKNQTRKQAFPDLEKSGRTWRPDTFCAKRVHEFFGKKIFNRKVSASGQINLCAKRFGGLSNVKELFVQVKFNHTDLHWEVYHDYKCIKRFDVAENFSEQRIKNLSVYQ